MVVEKLYPYTPDYAVSPGEILEETLDARSIKKSDLADRLNMSPKTISQILSGKAPVTPDTALALENVLGVPASTWNNLEANYRLHIARAERRKELCKHIDWVKSFPLNELNGWGLLRLTDDPVEVVEGILNFFGVSSPEAWQLKTAQLNVRFRRSTAFPSSKESIATWLRIGELRAAQIECSPFDKSHFEKALLKIRGLTCTDPVVFQSQMKQLCASAGIALVFFPELPNTHICGATEWLSKDKALLMLSLRYKTDDHLWFSFFHEAGHILLHGKKSIFIEKDGVEPDEAENQANRFAADFLISPENYSSLLKGNYRNAASIKTFAHKIGVTPGIVVGRLQHDGHLPFRSLLNNLKCKFEFTNKN